MVKLILEIEYTDDQSLKEWVEEEGWLSVTGHLSNKSSVEEVFFQSDAMIQEAEIIGYSIDGKEEFYPKDGDINLNKYPE